MSIPMPRPQFKEYQAEVLEAREPMHDHRILRLRLDDEISFTPGQFVQVMIDGIAKPASFSIASSPSEKREIEIAFDKVGPVTSALCRMRPGATFKVRGPLGRFTFTAEDGDVVALAGGVGITPFMSALRFIHDKRLPNKYTIFYSAKSKEGLIYYDEVSRIAAEDENVDAVCTVTRTIPDGWEGETRRCDAAMITTHVPDYKDRTFYVCGPKGFIDAMLGILEELDVPSEQIRRELW